MPATAEVEGLVMERRKGNVRELGPDQHFRCRYTIDCLAPDEARKLINKTNRLTD